MPANPDTPDPDPATPGPQVQIDVTLDAADVDPPLAGWLEGELSQIAVLAGVSHAIISVAVVDDQTMTDLNERYKGHAGTTDVLSFDLRDAPGAPQAPHVHAGLRLEGELVVCVDEAARQAAARGRDTRLEVLLYAVHGLMHLLGYDDATPPQAAQMHRREDELLTEAGFGPLFSD